MKTLYILLIGLCLMACQGKTALSESESGQTIETPQTFEEERKYSPKDYISSPRKTRGDVITRLYHEALEKDENLKQLHEEIEQFNEMKGDSMASYLAYKSNNDRYWRAVGSYTQRIKDTLLRKSTIELFEKLEAEYRTQFAGYPEIENKIQQKKITLEDQLLLMKLMVTYPMLKSYQQNEKPDIQPLKDISDEYNRLIDKTKEYIILEE
jgi:hypothetical protein